MNEHTAVDLDAIRARIAAIGAQASDPEVAHAAEDLLYIDVLYTIAKGYPDPAAIANAALECLALDFPRWAS